ncbi:hypothetical protein HAX54_010511, partial [Datura stramonium]|nr:hypothetical protein [Datura stramonium]
VSNRGQESSHESQVGFEVGCRVSSFGLVLRVGPWLQLVLKFGFANRGDRRLESGLGPM